MGSAPAPAATVPDLPRGNARGVAIDPQAPAGRRTPRLHPVLMMIAMLFVAVLLTHVIPAGRFDRVGEKVIPDTYRAVPRQTGWRALFATSVPTEADVPARASGFVALLTAIPDGMTKKAGLVVMVMFVGGMFGVLRATGAIDAGIDRLLHLAAGNVYLLSAGLMFLLACGATFLGFLSEYLAIVPLVAVIGHRLQLPPMFAAAVVLVGAMTGYCVSVTNPLTLAVAQPLAGVPIFSGLLARLTIFAVMFSLGLAYVIHYLRRLPKARHRPAPTRLTPRQTAVLLSVVLCGLALVGGTALRDWHNPELAAAFVEFGIVLAVVGGLRPGAAADAFLEGMKGMMLAGLMIGLGGAMDVILHSSQVLDTMIEGSAGLVHGHTPGVLAEGMFAAQIILDLLIHSTSAAASMSIPIMAPIAHLGGIDGQVTVTALLLGSGVTNMISPTNGLLLAFLAAAKVDYTEWFRFMAPLAAAYYAVSLLAIYLMTLAGAS